MDVKSLLAVLGEPGIQRTTAGVPRLRSALTMLLTIVNEGCCKDEDNLALVGSIAKVLPSQDLVVKRLACILLTRLPDAGLLVYNTLRKDCADANPLIRSLALRTILHISFAAFREPDSEKNVLIRGLGDSSAHVRRTAVLGLRRAHSMFGDGDDSYFSDRLYAMLRDPDPLVVFNCLSVLDQLLQDEGGVVVNRGIVRYLLSRMTQLPDFGVVQVLSVLRRRYVPESDDDKFSLMDSLDPLLQRRENSAVVFETTRLFLHLVGGDEAMRRQVFHRIAPRVSEFLVDASNAEIQYLWLQFVRENHQFFEGLNLRGLNCEYEDPTCIKVLKIEISTLLSREEDALLVLEELFAHCTDRSDAVSASAVRALGNLAVRTPRVANQCTGTLVRLLALERDATITATLFALSGLDVASYVETASDASSRLQEQLLKLSRSCNSAQANSALVRFLGTHGQLLECGPYLLEELMNESQTGANCSDDLKEALLVSGFRMLFARPAEMQLPFGRYAEQCQLSNEGQLAERVRFYFRLLRSDPNLAKRIICSNR